MKLGVILGQNCVLLSDTALNNLFFSKMLFIKSSANMLWTSGLLKLELPFYSLFREKVSFDISAVRCLSIYNNPWKQT